MLALRTTLLVLNLICFTEGTMKKEIYFAGGCFWGIEAFLKKINGVLDTEVGFANGKTAHPTYEDVCYKNTGHAETVKVLYDPAVISLEKLIRIFFKSIDPTSLNRQGNDCGTQYRAGIYFFDEKDAAIIQNEIANLQKNYSKKILVEVKRLANFYPAESYHQDYLDKNKNGYCHIPPQLFEYAQHANADAANEIVEE